MVWVDNTWWWGGTKTSFTSNCLVFGVFAFFIDLVGHIIFEFLACPANYMNLPRALRNSISRPLCASVIAELLADLVSSLVVVPPGNNSKCFANSIIFISVVLVTHSNFLGKYPCESVRPSRTLLDLCFVFVCWWKLQVTILILMPMLLQGSHQWWPHRVPHWPSWNNSTLPSG